MTRALWSRVVAAGVLLLGAVAAWYHLARRDRQSANLARADATEKAANATLGALHEQVEDLRRRGASESAEAVRLERMIAARKEALRAKFTGQGLTAGDIASRFQRMGL